jgi:Protein of unknown function (DUF3187)
MVFPGVVSPQETKPEEPVVADSDSSWRRPLGSRNQMPLSLLFVYLPPDRAESLPAGATGLDLSFDYSNIIQGQDSETELIHLDAEYLRTLVGLRRGLGGGVEVGVEIPFYVYYGGFLDSFVNAFHEKFGFPNYLRGQTPNGLVVLQYSREGSTMLSADQAFRAVGDLSFDVKKTLVAGEGGALAARGMVKLPTGKPETWSGSGAADVALGLAFDRVGDRFGFYANASYQFLGTTELVRSRDFFSLMLAFDWRFKPHLAAVLQVDAGTPPLEGELPLLNRNPSQLALGLRFRHSERFCYEWRLVEDLSTFSPDFTFAFQMGVTWKRHE